jgi:hypothetical protein
MEVVAEAERGAGVEGVAFVRLGFGRTARRLMQGVAYVPRTAVMAAAAIAGTSPTSDTVSAAATADAAA